MITIFQDLLLSSSKSMNVNGGTPKIFTYSPSAVVGILGISCVMKDEGHTSLNKFGANTALTNGILIQAIIGGVTTTIATIKDNSDLSRSFYFNQFGNGAVLSILGVSTAQGFGDTTNQFHGHMPLYYPGYLTTLDNGDTLQAVVQDDLTAIDFLEMRAILLQQ